MKHKHFKKLSAYSLMSAALLGGASEVDAQIVYTDIDPDETFDLQIYCCGEVSRYFQVDFNDDGINDIGFLMYTSSFSTSEGSSTVFVSALNYPGNFIRDNNFYGGGIGIEAIIKDDEIDAADNWNNNASPKMMWSYNDFFYQSGADGIFHTDGGYWHNKVKKFVGVKFLIDGNYHYGWVRLSTKLSPFADSYITFIDYAYEATAGESIIAGDMADCETPVPIGAGPIGAASAKLKWMPDAGVELYQIQYRPVGALSWSVKVVSGALTAKKISGLNCDTEYEWQIRSQCIGGEVSEYSESMTFTTASCRMEADDIVDEENIIVFSQANYVFVQFDEEITSEFSFVMFDQLGRVVSEQQIVDANSMFEVNVPAGIYYVTIRSADMQYSTQVAIQN